MSRNVIFAGYQADTAPYYALFDVFVLGVGLCAIVFRGKLANETMHVGFREMLLSEKLRCLSQSAQFFTTCYIEENVDKDLDDAAASANGKTVTNCAELIDVILDQIAHEVSVVDVCFRWKI